MPRYLLHLAYDGTAYVGWQRQANGVSVQQRLEEAVEPIAGCAAPVVGAGRTDAGVHALDQTAHVDLPAGLGLETVARAINSRLPRDIRVRRVEQVADDFHARFHARGKHYRYRWVISPTGQPLLERDAWRVPPPLDVEAMRDAAARLLGTHNFAGLQSTGSTTTGTVREIVGAAVREAAAAESRSLGLTVDETRLQLDVSGTGFLRHMVRAIAGTLTEIGRGRWPPDHMSTILALADRTLAGPTAPAHGLTLVAVDYEPAPTPARGDA